MAESGYHETGLSEEAKEIHRALASVREELDAVDWYNQRADVTTDEPLKGVLLHNRDEEIEHTAMGLEWLRRRVPKFDEALRVFLFTTEPIHEIETATNAQRPPEGEATTPVSGDLGIGKLA